MSGWGTIYDNMVSGMQTHAAELTRLQGQIASGKRVLRASDAPSDAFQIMNLHSQVGSLETYRKNLGQVVTLMEQSSSVLQKLSSALTNTRVELLQAANGTYNDSQRAGLAEALDAALVQAVSFANTEMLGQYIFSGDNVTTKPYIVEKTGDTITAVTYQGGLQNLIAPVAPGVQQHSTLIGEDVFRSNQRSEPLFYGNTGAAAGVGTSTVRGDVWLSVIHNTTTYAGATGVAAGSRSVDEDTIIGASHTLTIDADNNLARLDDGSFKPYDLTMANLELKNSAGDVIYVDMTGVVLAAGSVDVAITATGKLSIDDLATTVDLTTFTNNEDVVDSRDGRVLYIDAAGITRTGTEPVRVPGTYDLFGMLMNARDMLSNEQGLPSSQQVELIGKALDSLDEVMVGLTNSMTSVGGRLQAMDTLDGSMEDLKNDLDARKSVLQDADVIYIATELARTQTFYEMILSATAKVMSLSLLDYL